MGNTALADARTYATEDIYLAGALIANGKKFVSFYWKRGRASFELSDPMTCAQMSQAYFKGELRVPALLYADALKFLKARINEAVKKHRTVNVIP